MWIVMAEDYIGRQNLKIKWDEPEVIL